MSMEGQSIEFSDARTSEYDQLHSLGELSVRLVASQHRRGIQMPTSATLSIGCDRVVVDAVCGMRLEACLTPSTVVERRLVASSEIEGAWAVDLTATSGMTWALRLECESETEAVFVEGRIREAQLMIVASLHSVIVSSMGPSCAGGWYPSFEPLRGSLVDTKKGRFVLGGYVVVGSSKRRNHPALPLDFQLPESLRFRLVWSELRSSEKNGRVRLNCFFYPDHEHTLDGNLLDIVAFSSDPTRMEARGSTLVFYGTDPRDGVQSPCEVPGDVYLSFRHIAEARLWYDVSLLCLAHGFANQRAHQEQSVDWSHQLRELLGELAVQQSAPGYPKKPMFARAESRPWGKVRETSSKPADSISAIMDDVDRETEEIREILRRRQAEQEHIPSADATEWDGVGTVINA